MMNNQRFVHLASLIMVKAKGTQGLLICMGCKREWIWLFPQVQLLLFYLCWMIGIVYNFKLVFDFVALDNVWHFNGNNQKDIGSGDHFLWWTISKSTPTFISSFKKDLLSSKRNSVGGIVRWLELGDKDKLVRLLCKQYFL